MTLTEYLQAWPKEPFNWRTRNCAHFAAGWVKAYRGIDVFARLPGHSKLTDWLRYVEAHGIESVISEALRSEPIPGALAQQNDIMLGTGSHTGWTLGICNGRLTACLGLDGNVVFTDQVAEKAWRL